MTAVDVMASLKGEQHVSCLWGSSPAGGAQFQCEGQKRMRDRF